MNSDLSITEHIDNTLTSCGQSLFALKTLRAHGMPNPTICNVYWATALSKLLYACSAWWVFTSANDRHRLEAFIRKSKQFGYYSVSGSKFQELVENGDDKFIPQNLDQSYSCPSVSASTPNNAHLQFTHMTP